MRAPEDGEKGELPKGWCWARFSEVATIAANLVPPKEWPDLPHIAPDNIARDTGRLLPYRTVSEDGVTSAKHLFKSGQLLYSKIRPYLNKCVRVDFTGLCSADMYPLDAHIDPAYLHYYILSRRFISAVSEASGSRTVLPKTNQEQLSEISVPVAPLEEQRRIAETIDSYFTRLDDAVATLEHVDRDLKRYRSSVLKSAVEGRLVPTEAALAKQEGRDYEPASVLLERILTERRRRWPEFGQKGKYREPAAPDTANLPDLPEGWCWTTVDAVGHVLLGRRRAPEYVEGVDGRVLRKYVRVANVKLDYLDLDDLLSMPFSPNELELYRLKPGDIILSEGQSPELVGQSAIFRGGPEDICIQATVHRFRPYLITASYPQLVFLHYLHSGTFMRAASLTVNIAHLTLERLKPLPFPLAPLQEQRRISLAVDRHLLAFTHIRDELRQSSLRIARFRQAVLKWAFEGRLADQDLADEPASALLERIKTERGMQCSERAARHQRSAKKKLSRA